MKTFLFTIVSATILLSCSSQNTGAITTDATYGYSKDNPVKVGGVDSGPANERKYLNNLTGPNGEPVTFHRNGSCCAFETSNSSFGGMLDIYSVTYEGKGDTIKLYINMYDSAKLKAPLGFKMK